MRRPPGPKQPYSTLDSTASDDLGHWRTDRLLAAGFDRDLGAALAADRGFDLHELSDLDAATVAALPVDQLSDQASGLDLDAESRDWLADLRAAGTRGEEGRECLHALLLRAARFEISRRRAGLPHLRGDDFDDLAHHAAADAMVAILAKLDTFRGESRFTTWAYKFALLEAAVKLRRRAWQGREVPLEPEAWAGLPSEGLSPAAEAGSHELIGAIGAAIETELSPHQRHVLVAVALNGVPIDVLAERLGTTRGALYKTIHDARKKLRAKLSAEDLRFTEHLEPTKARS